MSDLRDLYQELIVDHNKRPRNFRKLEEANRQATGHNPLCGDELTVYLKFEDDKVREVSFQGSGCAISTASASLMTEAVKGKSRAEVEALFDLFHDLATGKSEASESNRLGKLAVFSGVSEYPVRVKCATLAWHTIRAAMRGTDETVTLE